MRNEVQFALYAIKKNLQSSAELRTSFVTNIIGMCINNTAFILLWVFFVQSVGIINGWTAADIVGLQGFLAFNYGIVMSLAYGLMKMPEYVASGAFDRFMLSPKNVLVRVATSAFGVSALGDVVFGLVTLGIYGALIQISLYQLLLLGLLAIISSSLYLAIMILVQATAFLFIDAESVTRGLFELFMTPSIFHGGAFQGVLRFIFTFLVPSLLLGSLPVETVRHASLETLLLLAVLAAIWLLVAILLFNKGIRKYESSNLISFSG